MDGSLAAEVWMGRLVNLSFFIGEIGFKQEKEGRSKGTKPKRFLHKTRLTLSIDICLLIQK